MATLFCFTSTGNSLYTAQKIGERIGGAVLPMSGENVACHDTVIGFVFPVFFWGLPRMVERFILNMQITNKDAYVFGVATSGGPVFGVLGQLKTLLKAKGVSLHYGARLISVSNYLPNNEDNDSEAFRQKIDQKIVKIAEEIAIRKTNRIMAFTPLNKLIYRYYPNEHSDQHFTITSQCSGCATCQKVCPADNIVIKNSQPCFLHRCEHCFPSQSD
jgi:ferredoxin